MSFQATEVLGDSYNALSTQYQHSYFSFGSSCSLGQMSSSDPNPVLTLITSHGSYQVPVDLHKASWKAHEKRAQRRSLSTIPRTQERKGERCEEQNCKASNKTTELEGRIKKLKWERNFYEVTRPIP